MFKCVFCSHTEQQSSPVIEPQTESDESKSEPLTVIQQAELISPQPTAATANQAMKGTFVSLGYNIDNNFYSLICVRTFFLGQLISSLLLSTKAKLARLSLALPPLALTLPPTGKGFGDGAIGNRIGRRRAVSPGSDPDEEEEDEQEDESLRRVIVVTETDVDKRIGLRSLLKSPKEPMDRERDRGRNVSFFDDVTIYLFDQVSVSISVIRVNARNCLKKTKQKE